MKKFTDILFSPKVTLVLLLLFAAAIGTATFIEEKYDTLTARVFIYNAVWFEAILGLLIVNFAGMIGRYKMLRIEKLPALLFHLAFIVMILGAGVTRYFGFEGTMHIREGEASSVIYSADSWLQVKYPGDNGQNYFEKKIMLGQYTGKDFHITLPVKGNKKLVLDYAGYAKSIPMLGIPAFGVTALIDGTKKDLLLFSEKPYGPEFHDAEINGVKFSVAYGPKEMSVPFSVRLEKFILDRYPGSNSPSSYASEVMLTDRVKGKTIRKRIYMNHVLDYDGYRFFQSSYDTDEKGTVLSVNHDFWGTWISYAGYILMALGFLLSLLNRTSRFRTLSSRIREIRAERKAAFTAVIAILFALVLPSGVSAQVQSPVIPDHAEKFGHLLVQTFDGRFEPVHTLATDAIHKISRKDKITTPEKGELNAMQLFLDLILDPGYWRTQKIVYIRDKSVGKVLSITGDYASFDDFISPEKSYKLAEYAEKAFRRKPAEQNAFDKEVVKVDERANLLLMLFKGNMLRIFPVQNDPRHRWISISDSNAMKPLTGLPSKEGELLGRSDTCYREIMRSYLLSLYEATVTKNYQIPDKFLAAMARIQREVTPPAIIPSPSRVNAEIRYNREHIFETLRNIYGLLSVILLVLAFADNLRDRRSRVLRALLAFFTIVLATAFLWHTYGLGMRWYLTGHAPWSNGYEALLTIGWGSLLAGFFFMRVSKISLAATVLLAFFVLMTAGHNSYDPQLTNLQPVLKSYWLVIHVAVITISYGFLALGFILGLINLVLFVVMRPGNAKRLGLIIRELTCTNEMSLLIGIVLATIGTFLGGVWASESWGRYWGWDAKETWALVIVITYAVILHLRFVPKMKGELTFNAASVIGFGSVIMTFVGVNYYLSKGLHSYAADDTKVFPVWAWILILMVILLIIIAFIRKRVISGKESTTSLSGENTTSLSGDSMTGSR
jgi:cytochrome c-type biogenesis protein CcsB